MVKIFIRANFQFNATLLTAIATAANPRRLNQKLNLFQQNHRSNQRGQPQRPVYKTQAPCCWSVGVFVCRFFKPP